ncbi:NifB/NifX family molybdenum-iron cluster-binding protein [Vibrio atypicus]|uniref:NifB/NifX family molybdenum-iron cluster-binding protein n=1 Tax=Vibrio atypicus TaxID=558271 RepID=UPI00135AF701|nr:NifB/NifX family molybdenum-iron cluster-binding protein [Vibrio atypicus]
MLFAIPCRESSLSNHFAKAPQIMLWDNQTNAKRILELPKSSSCCGHKHFWREVLQDNQVNAVVVRSIGSNMLSTLFKLNVRVLSAPRGFSLENFDENQLTPVTQIEFARPSANKNKANCSAAIGMRKAYSEVRVTGSRKLTNKLSPQAMNHLAKAFKLIDQQEKK